MKEYNNFLQARVGDALLLQHRGTGEIHRVTVLQFTGTCVCFFFHEDEERRWEMLNHFIGAEGDWRVQEHLPQEEKDRVIMGWEKVDEQLIGYRASIMPPALTPLVLRHPDYPGKIFRTRAVFVPSEDENKITLKPKEDSNAFWLLEIEEVLIETIDDISNLI